MIDWEASNKRTMIYININNVGDPNQFYIGKESYSSMVFFSYFHDENLD